MRTDYRTGWDHPRVGGEKGYLSSRMRSPAGSPPRGRGKGIKAKVFEGMDRITPAWAGKSEIWPIRHAVLYGSPPRGRGKVPSICKNMERVGITPAWAGKSWPWQRAAWRTRDHPRVGGEKNTKQKSGDKDTGSPPRGRGKGLDALEVAGFIGITPAWAGKSRF